MEIYGFINFTSNFVTPLKRKHSKYTLEECHNYLKSAKAIKRITKSEKSNFSIVSDNTLIEKISKFQFSENIVKYFIHSMTPLQITDDPYFKQIFEDIKITKKCLKLDVSSRRSLGRLIHEY